MPLPPDFIYVAGSLRRQVMNTLTGELMTRGTAETLNAQRFGFASDYEYKKWTKLAGGSSQVRDHIETARGNGLTAGEFKARAGAVAKEYAAHGKDKAGLDLSPTGNLANYLSAIGRRDFGADYSVGDTPGIK